MTIEQARQYYPVKTGLSDEQLGKLVDNLDVFLEKLLNDFFELEEKETKKYNSIKVYE